MPADNIIHYILYGVILIATVIILKWPKDKNKDDKNKKEDRK